LLYPNTILQDDNSMTNGFLWWNCGIWMLLGILKSQCRNISSLNVI